MTPTKFPFRSHRGAVAAALMLCLSPATLDAAYVTGVTATTTMGSGFTTNLQNTVNAAGLSSPSLTATHAGTIPPNSWVSQNGALTGTVTFNLRTPLVVTGFSFWNQNGGGPDPTGGTGIRSVAITYSTDGITFGPLPGAPAQFNQVAANANVPPQIVTFPGVLATHLRFQILSNYGDPGQTGFAEVAFNGAPNQPPTIAAPEIITTDEDTAANFTATTADPEGDPDEPPVPVFSTPAKGTIAGTRTNFTYTPNPNVNGSDSFTITAEDIHGGMTTRTVNVTITPVNDLPLFVSAPEALAMDEDSAVDFSVAATDVESKLVTFSFAGAAKGAISGEGGTYRYTPHPNANGGDSFTITALDGNGGTAIRTVSVTIAPINDVPIFTILPETLTTNEDTALGFNVAASDVDGDTVTFTSTNGQKGIVTGTGNSFTYMPDLNVNGSDSFTITANDGNGGTAIRTVSVAIAPINDAPIFTILPETLTTNEDTAFSFNVTASDVDGDTVTFTSTNGQKGIVTGTGNSFTYMPDLNVNGSDSFVVTISDGHGGVVSATVNVGITAVNDAPVFTFIPTALRTSEDTETNFTVTTSDVENDAVTVGFSGSSKGAISGSGPSYTYTPDPSAAGNDSFSVTATDGQGGITIRGVNVRIIGAPTVAGRYALLLADESGVHASLALILSRRGFLSGFLREENGQSERFHRTTQLPPGERSASIRLGNGSSLAVEFDSKGHVAATLTTSDRVLRGAGNVGVPPPANVPGRYTMVLDTGSGGFGWCAVVVSPRGSVRISGKLPDGAAISASQGMPIDGENNAPLFLLGKRRQIPVLSGSLHFATQPESDVTGALDFRNGNSGIACEAAGAQFIAGNSPLPPGSYPLAFVGEGVNITSNVILNSDNSATVESPLISLTPGGGVGRRGNGLFSVRFREEVAARGKGRGLVLSGTGVFIQKRGKGFGQFIKNGVTGQVLIGEQP